MLKKNVYYIFNFSNIEVFQYVQMRNKGLWTCDFIGEE